MKKFIIFAFVLLASQALQARERTQANLAKAALSVLQPGASTSKNKAASAPLKVLQQDAALTVMGNDALGFAVLSNDDAWPAVIGYSDAAFQPELNDGLKWFLTTASAAMSQGRQYAPVVPSGDFKPTVEPIVKTVWSQSSPYNDQCPTLTGGNPYPTGCVATALSQIMYGFKYPVHGTGKATLSVSAEGAGGIISVDFGAATYDWDNMLPDYKANSYTEEQAKAVSTLMLHCGVAVGMNYNPSGSGAYSHEARYGMITYFNYNPGINLLTRKYYSTAEWMKILYTELNTGRAIYYTGVDKSSGGHAFVCDGYNANGLVHINWGWGPEGGNGYYDVALLDPTGYQFSESQNILIGIAPTQVMNYASHVYGETGFTVSRVNKSLMKIDAGSMYNMTGENFTGEIACLMDMGDSLKVLKTLVADKIGNYYNVGTLSAMVKLQASTIPNGTYRVFIGSKSTKDKGWQLVRRVAGDVNSYMVTISNGDYTVRPITDDTWTTRVSRVEASAPKVRQGVYTIDGRYLGTNADRLGRGIYIINGKKVIKS